MDADTTCDAFWTPRRQRPSVRITGQVPEIEERTDAGRLVVAPSVDSRLRRNSRSTGSPSSQALTPLKVRFEVAISSRQRLPHVRLAATSAAVAHVRLTSRPLPQNDGACLNRHLGAFNPRRYDVRKKGQERHNVSRCATFVSRRPLSQA